ncbi:hypothetical protein [Flavobacterium sp. LC2016-23]
MFYIFIPRGSGKSF